MTLRPARIVEDPIVHARDVAGTAGAGAVGLAGAAIAAVGGFALAVTVARALGATGTGAFYSAVALFLIGTSVGLLGADTGLVRSLSRARAQGRLHDLRPTLWIAVIPATVASVALTLGLWYGAPALVDLLTRSDSAVSTSYLRACLGFLVFGTLSTLFLQATRGLGSLLPFTTIQNLFLPLVRPCLVALAVLLGLQAHAVPLAWALPLVPSALMAAFLARRRVSRLEARSGAATPPATPWRQLAREFWAYSAWRGMAAVTDLTLVWFGVLVLAALASSSEAGVYAAASRFVTTGTLVLQAMRLALAPQISALLATDQHARAEHVFRVATTWVVVLSWPLYLAMAVFSPVVLTVFGDDFTSGATTLTILALGMLVSLAAGNVNTVLLMGGRSGWVLVNKVLALAVNVTLSLVLIPSHGAVGAAVAWIAAIAVDNLLATYQVRRHMRLRGFDSSTALGALLSCACFGLLGLLVRQTIGTTWASFSVYAGLGTIAYAVVIWFLRRRFHLSEILLISRPRRSSAAESSGAVTGTDHERRRTEIGR